MPNLFIAIYKCVVYFYDEKNDCDRFERIIKERGYSFQHAKLFDAIVNVCYYYWR